RRRPAHVMRKDQEVEAQRVIDGGEALLEAARSLQVENIFCCSGSEWAPLWEAHRWQTDLGTPGPRYFDLWHETVAVGMATGFGLATGKLSFALVHASAGLLQGANAVHCAMRSGVGMVVASSESLTYGDDPDVPDPGAQWYKGLQAVGGTQAVAA